VRAMGWSSLGEGDDDEENGRDLAKRLSRLRNVVMVVAFSVGHQGAKVRRSRCEIGNNWQSSSLLVGGSAGD
jgi:hypothetical protein